MPDSWSYLTLNDSLEKIFPKVLALSISLELKDLDQQSVQWLRLARKYPLKALFVNLDTEFE